MGARLQSDNRSSGRFGRRRSNRVIAEINVTPFVDVMLVLLIVFMVTAPLLTAGVPVDLPQSSANSLNEEDDSPVEITVTAENDIYIGETKVERDRFINLLAAMMQANPDRRIFIRGDQALAYGQVMGVLGEVNKAGFSKVALISNPAK